MSINVGDEDSTVLQDDCDQMLTADDINSVLKSIEAKEAKGECEEKK